MKIGRPTFGTKPLKPIYIRLHEEDIRAARKVAQVQHLPYQRVLREWITTGARASGA